MNENTLQLTASIRMWIAIPGILLAALVLATAWRPATAEAAYPFSGAPLLYVGLEVESSSEERFAGMRPVGIRSIRWGEKEQAARVLTTDPADAGPAASPDGRLIAFSRGGALMLMRSDGGGLRQLTAGRSAEASFDPSGRRIYFAREGDVFAIRTDGTGLRRITSGRGDDRSPAVSPGGRQVVFGRTPAGKGFQRIYSVRPDGRGLQNLTPRIPARRRPGERNFSAEDPAFSPNGRVVAFTVKNNGGAENIYTMRPDGGRLRSLTGVGERPLSRRFALSEPAFSPSGRFLLVTARDRHRVGLAVIDLRDRSDLIGGEALQGEAPAWLP